MVRESREQTIDRILEATIHCVLEHDIDTVQLTQIATKAGMSARTLSRYYPGKETLLAEAATKYLRDRYSSFVEEYEKIPKDNLNGRQKLLLFLNSQQNYFNSNTLEAMMLVDLRFYRICHNEVRASWAIPGGNEVRSIVVSCIVEGQQDGSVRLDIDPTQTSMLISATYNGMMQRLTLIYRSRLPEETKESLYFLFGRYIDMAERYLKP